MERNGITENTKKTGWQAGKMRGTMEKGVAFTKWDLEDYQGKFDTKNGLNPGLWAMGGAERNPSR